MEDKGERRGGEFGNEGTGTVHSENDVLLVRYSYVYIRYAYVTQSLAYVMYTLLIRFHTLRIGW